MYYSQRVQTDLIRLGLIDWLVSYISTLVSKMSDYCLEYATALLMNLCLNSTGRVACVRVADALMKLMIVLMAHNNNDVWIIFSLYIYLLLLSQIQPYVNGILYSALGSARIRMKAKELVCEHSFHPIFISLFSKCQLHCNVQ
jgi:hypothetical protein